MSAWGASAKSCKSLLDKVEQNDVRLTELFILPTKTFGGPEVDRLAQIIEQGKNTTLKKLSASGHQIPNESLYNLGKAIASQNSTLSSLAIGDNSMGHTGVLAFTKGLTEGGGNTQLEEIDLSWKGIGSSGFELILNSFSKTSSPKVHQMNLRRNEKIGETSNETPNLSFAAISHVETLDLSQCDLSGDFVAKFFACLQQQSTTAETTENVTIEASNLRKLSLQENELSVAGFHALMPLLVNSPLTELNLASCGIGDDALEALAKTLTDSAIVSTNLQVLDLSNNGITSTGAAHLAESLQKSGVLSSLLELNLAGNQLGEEGITLLAKALEEKHHNNSNEPTATLKKLDLTNTNCGMQGAMDIITLGKLQSLHLFNNTLGSEGFIALAPTLKGGHASLEHLDLGGNGANQASVVALLSALLENPEAVQNTLKVIVVGANESGDAVEQIAKQIKEVHPALDIARDKKSKKAPDEQE